MSTTAPTVHIPAASATPRATTFVGDVVVPAGLGLSLAVLLAVPWLYQSLALWVIVGNSLTLLLITKKSWATTWWACLLWGFVAIAIAFHWTPHAMAYTLGSSFELGLLVALPLLLWDGLRFGGIYWLAGRVCQDNRCVWLPAALIAIAAEAFLPSVFPWRVGYTLMAFPWMIQGADIFGGAWTTFIAFATAGSLLIAVDYVKWLNRASKVADSTQRNTSTQRKWCDTICLSAMAFTIIYAAWSLPRWENRSTESAQLSIAVIQEDPGTTESLGKLQQRTNAISPAVDLVCWPESSGGSYAMELADLSDSAQVFAQSREPERGLQPWPQPKSELLLGGKNYRGQGEAPDELFVTAMLIDRQQKITGRYNKRYLMPFGEYVPGEQTVPGLSELFDMAEHVQPGTETQPILTRSGARVGSMLCYEDMVPASAIDMTRHGADMLVCLINGSAFESPFTLMQHRLLAQLRAVECRKAFVRCAATGESCVITPTGVISHRLPLQTPGTLVAQIPRLPGETFYTQVPWLGSTLSCFGLAMWMASRVKRQVNRRGLLRPASS